MRDLINIIDQVALFEAREVTARELGNRISNRTALKQELRNLFNSLGEFEAPGAGVSISRSLLNPDHGNTILRYTISILTHNFTDSDIDDYIDKKLENIKGKHLHRGLSGKIQKIMIKYVPYWQHLDYAKVRYSGFDIVGYVDLSKHIPL